MRRLSLLALACALAAPAAAHATFPGGNGRIAFDLRGKNLDDAGQATYRAIATLKPDSRGDRFVRECQINGAGVRDGRLRDRVPLARPGRPTAGGWRSTPAGRWR